MTALTLSAASAADAVAFPTRDLAPSPTIAPTEAASILRFAAASPTRTREAGDDAVSAAPEAHVAALRARALADVKRLRALARAARGDGLPQAALRAANASAAARSVLGHARRFSAPRPCPSEPLEAAVGAE